MTMDVLARQTTAPAFDVEAIRADFPILSQKVNGRRLAFLDTAASAQKPVPVMEAERRLYETYYANVHRGVYALSQRSTDAFEAARRTVARFLNARSDREIVFVRGATEGINLVAQSWGRTNLGPGDEVLISEMEHHANIVPWQILRDQVGFTLKVAAVTDQGTLDMESLDALLSERTKLVAITHVSNALGTINPVAEIARKAHALGAKVLFDGCQAVPHLPVDVQALGADFYVFSGHKLYGPTGIGVLYAREEILTDMPPYQGGGEMIRSVTFEKTTFADIPLRFEAGTPHIAGAIGLAAAIDYVENIGRAAMRDHDQELLAYATERLSAVPGLAIHGTAPHKVGVVAFLMEGTHPHDIGTILDEQGVAVRAGHHCAQPLMDRFGYAATARASFGLYTVKEDIDQLVDALEEVRRIFG
jgi:cysteine desulfurase/selenocysteine lyase